MSGASHTVLCGFLHGLFEVGTRRRECQEHHTRRNVFFFSEYRLVVEHFFSSRNTA